MLREKYLDVKRKVSLFSKQSLFAAYERIFATLERIFKPLEYTFASCEQRILAIFIEQTLSISIILDLQL